MCTEKKPAAIAGEAKSPDARAMRALLREAGK